MSHTATIKAIKIQSIAALRAAVREMNETGIKCELLEDGKAPRAFYPDQPGMGPAPYVLKLTDCRYDIGFYAVEGGYEARTDFWAGHVEKVVGAEACSIESKDQAKLGKMFQMYGIHATIEAARKKGHTVMRKTGKDGAVQLIVSGM